MVESLELHISITHSTLSNLVKDQSRMCTARLNTAISLCIARLETSEGIR